MSDIGGDYNKLFDCYNVALEEVKNFVYQSLSKFCKQNSVNCMSSYRIKSQESIKRKMEEKNRGIDSICDIAGIRIVFCDFSDLQDLCVLDQDIRNWEKNEFITNFYDAVGRYKNHFIDTIYDFREYIRVQAQGNIDFKVIIDEKKDYIKYPKKSGYQSIHMVISYRGIPVELQIRNLVQHYFAEYEHKYYKDDNYTRSEYNPICNECADTLSNITCDYSADSYVKKTLVKNLKIG